MIRQKRVRKRVKHRKRCKILFYCRIYHKFVRFIILNTFKVIKWKSCFILLRGMLVLWYGSQINALHYTKRKQTSPGVPLEFQLRMKNGIFRHSAVFLYYWVNSEGNICVTNDHGHAPLVFITIVAISHDKSPSLWQE